MESGHPTIDVRSRAPAPIPARTVLAGRNASLRAPVCSRMHRRTDKPGPAIPGLSVPAIGSGPDDCREMDRSAAQSIQWPGRLPRQRKLRSPKALDEVERSSVELERAGWGGLAV